MKASKGLGKVSDRALRHRRQGLVKLLPPAGEVLRGSLVERYVTCGNPSCKCARGERHGPMWYLTVTLGPGNPFQIVFQPLEVLDPAPNLFVAGYLNKVFGFRRLAAGLYDALTDPDFSPQSVFLTVFHGFFFRLRSFQQLEADLSQPAFQHWIGAPRALSDDVLRYSLCGFDLAALQQMLVQVNRTLKRNKAFDEGRVQGRIVAALDGIEAVSSYSRHCDSCLQWHVTFTDRQGHSEERIQYYHCAVGCQIIMRDTPGEHSVPSTSSSRSRGLWPW